MLHKVLDRKETFLTIKTKYFQRLKKWHFSDALTHVFGQKMQFFFHYLFSLKVRLELGVNNVRDRKTTFFDYKNKIFYSLKNCLFAKGLTHVFG